MSEDSERIRRGTEALLTRRREILAQGADPIGWKIGFNVHAVQEQLGIDRPVVGFLTSDTLLAPETDWSIEEEGPVVVESEVAVEIGPDGRSIAAVLPALELADMPDLELEIEQILAGDIFHRGVAFGPRVEGRDPGIGRIEVNGETQHTLTAAERDSVLQAISASVPYLAKRARDSAGRAGDCPGCAGIPAPPSPSHMPVPVKIGGISIPLPGGGPSPAQRKRDSTINAHTLPILDRLKQRADSMKAARRRDSLEAIKRRDSLEAIQKQRRDSTSGVKPQHDSSSTFPPSIASTTCVLPRCRTQAVPLYSRWRSSAQPSSRFPDS